MGKKSGKTAPAKVDPVYVLGLDANGKPRGARFAELKDSIVSAAMDMKCRVLIDQPEAVSALGMKLPVGRVYGGGKVVKLFVPTSGVNSTTRYWKRRVRLRRRACRRKTKCSGAGFREHSDKERNGRCDGRSKMYLSGNVGLTSQLGGDRRRPHGLGS